MVNANCQRLMSMGSSKIYLLVALVVVDTGAPTKRTSTL
jgi:hypothetical protein